jgi:hypothetical protein
MAGLETQWGHYRIVDSHGNVTEGDAWLCNNTTTPGHKYVGNVYGDSDYIQEFSGKYGTYYSAHLKPLSGSYRDANAWCIYKGLKAAGWSVEAIAGLCGNIQNESAFSPGRYEKDKKRPWPYANWGCGLTQWTPNFKLFDWCKNNGDVHVYAIESQIDCINYESLNNIQYGRASSWPYAGEIPKTFTAYRVSTMSPFQLGKAFWYCYERPKDPSEANGNARGRNAEKWYKFFTGSEPPTPVDPTPDPGPSDGDNCTYIESYAYSDPNYTIYVKAGDYFERYLYLAQMNIYELPDGSRGNIQNTVACEKYEVRSGELPSGCAFEIRNGAVAYPSKVWGAQNDDGVWQLHAQWEYGQGPCLVVSGSPAVPGKYEVGVTISNAKWNVSAYYGLKITVTKRLKMSVLFALLNKEELLNASNSRLLR